MCPMLSYFSWYLNILTVKWHTKPDMWMSEKSSSRCQFHVFSSQCDLRTKSKCDVHLGISILSCQLSLSLSLSPRKIKIRLRRLHADVPFFRLLVDSFPFRWGDGNDADAVSHCHTLWDERVWRRYINRSLCKSLCPPSDFYVSPPLHSIFSASSVFVRENLSCHVMKILFSFFCDP